jgi:hypothetical protein
MREISGTTESLSLLSEFGQIITTYGEQPSQPDNET